MALNGSGFINMRSINRALMCLAFLLLLIRAGAAPYEITYVVTPAPPGATAEGTTHVTVSIAGVKNEKTIRLQMPVWSPGDYHVMNHAKYVGDLRARSPRGRDLAVTHPDANTWDVATRGEKTVQVTYDLPNEPPGFFSQNAKVAEKYAFYNGPATYVYVVGHKIDPAHLRVVVPQGWKKAITPLDPEPSAGSGAEPAGYVAPDYDTLADSPVVAGDYVTRSFSFAGRPHTLVFFNAYTGVDFDSFLPLYEKIVAEENRLMGGPPYKQYVFFIDVNGPGGGLEHLNSHRISYRNGSLARFVVGGVAHEFFHLWNVKRIRPAVLGPFDYIDPPHTRNLWFSEGVTEYYAGLSSLRAGLRSEENYLENLGGLIGVLQSIPARKRVTADESSLRVWEANNSSGYGGLNYYLKGELIGLCLDLKIRGVTQDRKSLDDVMRDLLARFGLPKPGFPEDGLRDAVIRAGGPDLGPFYDLLARSTEEMPFAQCLRIAGLRLHDDGRGVFAIEIDPQASEDAVALRKAWLRGARPDAAHGSRTDKRAVTDRAAAPLTERTRLAVAGG